jgi:hypothetical protein
MVPENQRNHSRNYLEIFLDPRFLSYPLWEHMCVFDGRAGEQQNSDEAFGQARAEGGTGDGYRSEKQGAAIWADISVPVVQPDGWPVYHLRMGMRELERLRRENDAAMALLVGAMPESRDTVADIARNAGVSNREARRRKSVADVCGKVKGALEKLQSGDISNEHVSALAPVADMPGAASLLDDAASKSPEELTRDVEEFRLSSACGDDMAKRQRARRMLRFFAGPEGMIGINGLLPPVEGTELKNRLAAMVDAKWRADHPERAKELGGHGGDTYDQRMADALLDIAGVRSGLDNPSTRSSTGSTTKAGDVSNNTDPGEATQWPKPTEVPDHPEASVRKPRASVVSSGEASRPGQAISMSVGLRLVGLQEPTVRGGSPPGVSRSNAPPRAGAITVKTGKPAVVIVFDVDKWKARIAGGGPLPITESLLDQARNELYYCFKNVVGEVIKFGRSRRDPTPIQRLVLVVRDERCLYPGCHAPPDRCDAHHTNEVVKDNGNTDTDAMGLFCEAHHRHIHLNDLIVKRNLDMSITIIERRTGAVVASTTKKRAA